MSFANDLSVIALIDSMSSQFTKTDWKIVQFIKNNPDLFTSLPAADIASRIGTSDASIIRFSQKIGLDGFYELRTRYKRELKNKANTGTSESNYFSQFQEDYTLSIQRLFSAVDELKINTFINHITSTKKIYVCAFKQYSDIAHLISSKFLLVGIKMQPITNMNEFRLHVSQAQRKDLFIVIDLNANIFSLNTEFNLLKKHQATIILFSELQRSKLVDQSDLHLILPTMADLLSEFAISNYVLVQILIDLIFNSLLQADPNKYAITLAQSIELTKFDQKTQMQTSKLKGIFSK